MRKPILSLFLSLMCLIVNAQIIRVATSPTVISNQIPGYSQVSTIATKTYSYTPSTPILPPIPIDEDSTTEDGKR